MNDLEQECEDALFEVCDARERFPFKCADELQKCIRLKNEINTLKVSLKPITPMDIPSLSDEQVAYLSKNEDKRNEFEYFDRKLETLTGNLHNLKSTMEQIKRERNCELNKLLRN